MDNLDKPFDYYRDIHWDYIVVGTGAGGAAFGYEMAQRGKRVLWIEKGRSYLHDHSPILGQFAEMACQKMPTTDYEEVFRRAGRWSEPIDDLSQRPVSYLPFAGSGIGGSTAIYGSLLNRFYAEDFCPRQIYGSPREGNLPERWPISYDDLRPFYKRLEDLFRVKGQLDPLRLTELDQISTRALPQPDTGEYEILEHLRSRGLTPYQPPLAIDLPDCLGCQSVLCPRACKNDAAKIFVKPALQTGNAELLLGAQAIKLKVDRNHAAEVLVRSHGQDMALRADNFVLCAGALVTPQILMQSYNSFWPRGVGNDRDLLGRNLMRNLYDLFVLKPSIPGPYSGLKEIFVPDFYPANGGRLGVIHSFGAAPPAAILAQEFIADLKASRFSPIARLVAPFKQAIETYANHHICENMLMVATLDDLPQLSNRVTYSNGRVRVHYNVSRFDCGRVNLMRRKIKQTFSPYLQRLEKQAEHNRHFIALACGTCRFGDSPETSVLDKNNRVHGFENLFVLDASFFPTNPGQNSSLTIMANALRVAAGISN